MVDLIDAAIEAAAGQGFKREIEIGGKRVTFESPEAMRRLRDLYARQAAADSGSVIGSVPTILQRLRP